MFNRIGWNGSTGTYKFEDNLFYRNSYYDTVFLIFPDLSNKASFIISSGEHRLPGSNFDPSQLKNYLHLYQIMETSRFLTISYFYKKRVFVL
jgi:hypothetical protein